MRIDFFVPGIPQPGGSKVGFINPKTQRVIVMDDNRRVKPWRQEVIAAALSVFKGAPTIDALVLDVKFHMPRPKHHYGTGKNSSSLKPSAPRYHTTKPDRTKLLRALEDALTGIVWKDDTQIVAGTTMKLYATGRVGAEVKIRKAVEL